MRFGGPQVGGDRVGHGDAPVGEQPLPAHQDGDAGDPAEDAESLQVGEAVHGGQATEPVGGGRGDGPGDRVFAGVFDRPGVAEDRVGGGRGGGVHVEQGHRAGGDGAGLVQHDGVDPAGGFEDLGSF